MKNLTKCLITPSMAGEEMIKLGGCATMGFEIHDHILETEPELLVMSLDDFSQELRRRSVDWWPKTQDG